MNRSLFLVLTRFSLLLLFVILTNKTFSQVNPLYADKLPTQGYEHWLFTGYDDSVNGSWSSVTPLGTALYGVNAYYWEGNGKIFICGGSTQDGVIQSACWWYDPVSDTYAPAASLPHGRWSGKLVRVLDSLYLIGSVDSTFISADGMIFRYSLTQNVWAQKTNMPVPYVHESAVAVINDTVIGVIGGSTNAFLNPLNLLRTYNPAKDSWKNITGSSVFPVNNTTAHAEFLKPDTTGYIFVLGGYGGGALNTVFRGTVSFPMDTLDIAWDLFDTLNAGLFGQPVYRVAGSRWNNTALFGPALNGANTVNAIWGLKFYNDTDYVWSKFEPGSPDSAANISTFAAYSGIDSNYFYMFGGFKNPNVVANGSRYAFVTPPPPPIGISNTGGVVPKQFILYQNYPNPFNPATKIRFSVPSAGLVKLVVFDLLGREVNSLINDVLPAGNYTADFNASLLSTGIYFYRMESAGFTETQKMILVK